MSLQLAQIVLMELIVKSRVIARTVITKWAVQSQDHVRMDTVAITVKVLFHFTDYDILI